MLSVKPRGSSTRVIVGACALLFILPAANTPSAVAEVGVCPPAPVAVSAPAPDPSTQPSQSPQSVVVACVAAQQITLATVQHWSLVAVAEEGSKPKHPQSAQAIVTEAMSFLISTDWLIGEAQTLDVHVTAAQVNREFNKVRKQQFPKHKDFRAFLRQTKQTVADLHLRTRAQLLSGGIQQRVLAGHHGTRSQQKALKNFVTDFNQTWTNQTYCTPQYAVPTCGHVQASI